MSENKKRFGFSNTNKSHKSKGSFLAAHQKSGLWSELKPDITWEKKDDKWFCHQIQTKPMKGKLSKSPPVTAEHEMIFSCCFDGLDNTRWQWMGRTPNRGHTQVWRGCFVCRHKDKKKLFFLFCLILRKGGLFLCLICLVYSEHEWVPLVGLQ